MESSLGGFVLSNPAVEFSDGVVKEDPLLDKSVDLLDPIVRGGLDLVISLLESSNLSISLSMGGHLLGSSLSSSKNLLVADSGLDEDEDLVIQSLDLVEVRWLSKTFTRGLLSIHKPGGELLDSCSVLSPELDIIGVLVALNLGGGLEISDVLGDAGKLIFPGLGISRDLITLGQDSLFSCSQVLDDLNLGGNIFLEVHGPGDPVFRKHGARGRLDVIELSSGSQHPGVHGLQGALKGLEGCNKLLDLTNSGLEASNNLKLLLNSLNFLCENLLLVLGDGERHAGEQTSDGVIALLEETLPLSKISSSSFKGKVLLNLLDFLFGNFKFSGNSFTILSIADPSFLGVIEELKPLLGLQLGFLPSIGDSLDMTLKELGFVGIFKDDLTLGNEVSHNGPLGVKLGEGLLLPLNQLINILYTGWSNLTSGRQHDSIKEFNMGLQLVTIGIALPVQINHNGSLLDSGDELLVLLDEDLELFVLSLREILGSAFHEDLQDLSKPFLHFCAFNVLA